MLMLECQSTDIDLTWSIRTGPMGFEYPTQPITHNPCGYWKPVGVTQGGVGVCPSAFAGGQLAYVQVGLQGQLEKPVGGD